MNQTSNDTSGFCQEWLTARVDGVVLGAYGVICAVGLAGNLLVCAVLLRVPSLRSNTSDFLVHLSLVDILVCLLVVPYRIIYRLQRPLPPLTGFLGQLRCRLYVGQFPFWLCTSASIFSLVTVNLERFAATVYPLRYKSIFGRRNKLLMIVTCWILAALSQCFIVFINQLDQYGVCKYIDWPSREIRAVFGVSFIITILIAPFLLMVMVQWKVIRTLKKQVRALTGQAARWTETAAGRHKMWQLRTTQTLVRTLFAFVLTFGLCWTPNQFLFLLDNLSVRVCYPLFIYHVSVIMAVGNSCVNPLIYTVTNQAFRRGIRDVFCPARSAVRVGNAQVTSRM